MCHTKVAHSSQQTGPYSSPRQGIPANASAMGRVPFCPLGWPQQYAARADGILLALHRGAKKLDARDVIEAGNKMVPRAPWPRASTGRSFRLNRCDAQLALTGLTSRKDCTEPTAAQSCGWPKHSRGLRCAASRGRDNGNARTSLSLQTTRHFRTLLHRRYSQAESLLTPTQNRMRDAGPSSGTFVRWTVSGPRSSGRPVDTRVSRGLNCCQQGRGKS
jgi:hypothetical protein